MILIGLFLSVGGLMKSNFVIYRILAARSRILWGEGDDVHNFYDVGGALVILFGILFAAGLFDK